MDRIVYGWRTAGVCDRLASMMLLHFIAQKTGRKALWHWMANQACNCPFHDLFETDLIDVSENTFGINGTRIGEGCGTITGNEVIRRAEHHSDHPILVIADGCFGINYDGLDQVICPSREVQRLVNQFMESNWRDKMIGVHVRTLRKDEGPPSLERYFSAVDKVMDADSGIFVSSDDPTVPDLFANRYGRCVSMYPVRSYDRNCHHGIVDAVASLYLLRNTFGVIGSEVSSYSMCAGWDCGLINLLPDKRINSSWSGELLTFKAVGFRHPEIIHE